MWSERFVSKQVHLAVATLGRSYLAFLRRPLGLGRLGLLALALGAIAVGQAQPTGKVYVTNQASGTVSVIDVASSSVVATVAVGDNPHNVNHSADGRWILVTNKNNNVDSPPSLSIIDPRIDEVVATVEGIGSRIEHVVSPRPGLAYVTEDLERNAVAIIDLENQRVSGYIPVGVKPHGLWFSPDGRWLFVPNQLSGTVSKIDLSSQQVVGEAMVGRTPTMVAVTPDGESVYVTLFGERAVAVLNANLVESQRLQINDVIPVGERPAQVTVTPDGRYVLVPVEGPGALVVIEEDTHEVIASIPTGRRAHGVDVSSDSSLAFVSNWGDGTLSIVDLSAMEVVQQVTIGDEPAGVDYLDVAP